MREGVDFRRLNLTSTDVRFRRLQSIPAYWSTDAEPILTQHWSNVLCSLGCDWFKKNYFHLGIYLRHTHGLMTFWWTISHGVKSKQNVINTRYRTNAGSTFAHRLRRWANKKPTLGEGLVYVLPILILPDIIMNNYQHQKRLVNQCK